MFKIITSKKKLQLLEKVEELVKVSDEINTVTDEIVLSFLHNDLVGKTEMEDQRRDLCRKRDILIKELKFPNCFQCQRVAK